jgi:hypothetical protein
MNNKIKIDNFWKAGGICEIELYPDITRFLNTGYVLFANSKESFIESYRKLFSIYTELLYKYNVGIRSEKHIIRSVRFLLNGISYTLDGNFPLDVTTERKETRYLVATGKYYRGATI